MSIVVVMTTSGALEYVRSVLSLDQDNPITEHPLNLALRPLLMLAVLGVILGAVNSIFNTHECISFVTGMTTSAVNAGTAWQWLWVLLSCLASISTLLMLAQILPCGQHHVSKAHRALWMAYTCTGVRLADPFLDGEAAKRAIKEWVSGTQNSRQGSMCYSLLSLALHIPILVIAGVPAFAYVTCMQNVAVVLNTVIFRCWPRMFLRQAVHIGINQF